MEAIYADLDKIVFENKEKAYGGYAIRQQAGRMLTRATLIALLMFLSITALPKIISWAFPTIPIEICEEEIVTKDWVLEDIPIAEVKDEKMVLPPEPPQPAPPKISTIAFPIPNPSETASEDEEIRSMDELMEGNIGKFDVDGEDGPPTIPWDEIDDEIGTTFTEPFEEPHDEEDVNGMDRLPEAINMDDFRSKVVYPKIALENGIRGMVVVKIRVEKDGTYMEHKVVKTPHVLLSQAVEAQIKTLRFLPALKKGKPVRFWVSIPVNFTPLN